jgi:hypothetical protein
MVTPEQVLTASPEQLRRWCGLLQYGDVRDMWVYPWPDGGFHCTEQECPDSTREPCAPVLVREDGTPFHWQPLPDYTVSLDAIWPLQSKVANSPRFAQVVDGLIQNEPLSMIYWPPEDLVRCIVATAETRARAVCLTLLDELNALLEENDRG